MKEELYDTLLSRQSFDWITDWSWKAKGGMEKEPSEKVKKELSRFKPSHPVLLYRGTKDTIANENKKKYRSFSYQRGYAESIAEVGDFHIEDGNEGCVIEQTVSPEDILVDITKIPNYKKYFTNEVIVRGGLEKKYHESGGWIKCEHCGK